MVEPACKKRGDQWSTRHQSRLPITLVVILGVCAAPSAAFAQAGTITKGIAGQLRQRLQEVLRRLWAADQRAEPLHEKGGAELVAGLREALVLAERSRKPRSIASRHK